MRKGTRREVSDISNRYSKANNKCLQSYDPKQEVKHIIYLDAINMYGYAMSKFLATTGPKWIQESKHIMYLNTNNMYGYVMSKFLAASGLKWMYPKEFELNKYTSNSLKGCVLQEVDLKYLEELRELHNNYRYPSGKRVSWRLQRDKFLYLPATLYLWFNKPRYQSWIINNWLQSS